MVTRVGKLKQESETTLNNYQKFKDFIGYRAKEMDFRKIFEEPTQREKSVSKSRQ